MKAALDQACYLLAQLDSENVRLEAEILLAHVLGKSRVFLYSHSEVQLTAHQLQCFQHLIESRIRGIPIAYLTGIREFWSMPLLVSEDTLIPRPETELLVELALKFLQTPLATVLDMGTGSGAIALALASERPQWQLVACDISASALTVAKKNAEKQKLNNIKFYCSDWFEKLADKKFNAILSNPPYIAAYDPHLDQGDIRFEPKQALVSGQDGLTALKYLISHAYHYLLPGGFLLVEHGFDQQSAVLKLFEQAGYITIQAWQDWQGNDRVCGGWRVNS